MALPLIPDDDSEWSDDDDLIDPEVCSLMTIDIRAKFSRKRSVRLLSRMPRRSARRRKTPMVVRVPVPKLLLC